MIWFLFALIAFAVLGALLWPLLRAPAPLGERADYDRAVFRDQLEEVDRDVARGVLTATEAAAARVEIQRRMLAAGKTPSRRVGGESPQARSLLTAGLAVLVPFAALGLYLTVGAPQLAAHRAADTAAAEHQNADMVALVDKLAARMRETPDNAEGWSLLARSYRQMERFADAAEAYRNLMRLAPDDADGFAGFGEVATAAAGGQVTAEAHDAFVQALRLDASEPRAQFYLGLERAQAGDAKGAIAIWRALTAAAPKDAPWLGMVRGQMAQVAQTAGIMPMSVQPQNALDVIGAAAPPPAAAAQPQASAAPGEPDVTALKGRFSAENLDMIKGMVGGLAARLASDPNDFNGWMMLGRSFTVLNNTAGAADAYRHAVALKPTDLAPKVQLAGVLLADSGDAPTPALVTLAEDIRKQDPHQALALYVLGLAKAHDGEAAAARTLWDDAVRALPADSPLRGEIARRKAALR